MDEDWGRYMCSSKQQQQQQQQHFTYKMLLFFFDGHLCVVKRGYKQVSNHMISGTFDRTALWFVNGGTHKKDDRPGSRSPIR